MALQDIETNVEASLLRYLYQNLEVDRGIAVVEDIHDQDFDAHTRWVVIDSLGNPLGDQPRQNYFLHASLHKQAPNAKAEVTALAGLVRRLVDKGQEIELYDYENGMQIGQMTVTRCSLSPVLQHNGGGAMRSVSITLAYPAY